MIRRKKTVRHSRITENKYYPRHKRFNRLGESQRMKISRSRRLNEDYADTRYDDEFWDKLDKAYIDEVDLDTDELVKDYCEANEVDPEDYPEGSTEYWELVGGLIDDEFRLTEEQVNDFSKTEVDKYLRSVGYNGFDPDDIETVGSVHGNAMFFCWNENALNGWVAHEFLVKAKDFLKKNGFDVYEIDAFEQLFLAEYAPESLYSDSPMDESDIETVFYDEPELKDKLSDPKILKGLGKAHKEAYENVFELANKGMKILKDDNALLKI